MLRDQIKEAMKAALKEGKKEELVTLRVILAAIKDKDVEMRVDNSEDTEAQDAHILRLLEGLIKQRRQSIEMYQSADRADLAAKENAEIEVIQKFLPHQLSQAEQDQAIQQCIQETGATSIKDMSTVMACLRSAYTGQMDFGKSAGKIKEFLA
tara:strand:+ start:363 stop:821 length:459 start_codon:yes stop_codon:yes gene_type:complete